MTTKKAHSNIILISNINNQSLQVIYSFIFWCESKLFISTLPIQAISAIYLIINIGILSLILSLFGFSGVGILSIPYALFERVNQECKEFVEEKYIEDCID